MEALIGQPVASPALHHLTLRVLSTIDTWASDPARLAFERLVDDVDDDEIALLPSSIGDVLPLLEASRDRLRIGFEIVTRYDLFEAARGLSILVWQGDPEATLAAATLHSHPAVTGEFRDLIGTHLAFLDAEWEQDLFLTRLRLDHVPKSAPAQAERRLRWIPRSPRDAAFAAAAVEVGSDLDSRTEFRMVLDLAAAGVAVRRVPTGLNPPDVWLPRWVPRIGSNAHGLALKSGASAADRQRIVRQVLAFAPSAWKAKHALAPSERLLPLEALDVAVFDDGAMPRREVAYLSGVRTKQMANMRKYDSLAPFYFRGAAYWRFSQVVGLRAAQYLFRLSDRRRGLVDVADRLVRVARENSRVPAGITTDGRVLVNENGVLYDVESGQLAEEDVITFTDEVFRPFSLDDRVVPGLLRPSLLTSVHPSIVRGLPCVEGTRVTVGAVAHAVAAARNSNHAAPIEFAAKAFGLTPDQIRDAEGVATAIAAVP
ncbi:MAG: hypothetical protein QOF60_377 [Actinomycetota bacterium]|nr:hypothetical protein [Actinomycetota bacterium]